MRKPKETRPLGAPKRECAAFSSASLDVVSPGKVFHPGAGSRYHPEALDHRIEHLGGCRMRRTLGAVQWTGRIRLRLRPRWALACVVVPVVACATLRADEEAAKDEVFEKVARPFLESYCLGCHSDAR